MLKQPTTEEHGEVMRRFRHAGSGMEGERGQLPESPDDPVAYKLLDAAGDAIGRGERQKGINILQLVVKDYRHTEEAACARLALDRLAGNGRSHGR